MLQARWLKLMASLGLSDNKETFHLIMNAYSAKVRNYHSVNHLLSVLECLDRTAYLAENSDEVEVALWFHDAVYKPFSHSNELDSANWALGFLQKSGASKTRQKRVFDLVMVTAHATSPGSIDEKLIVDIDLSVLGQDNAVYKEFSKGVRQEYRKVPAFIYRRKRKEVLLSFLRRKRIYFFEQFIEMYEASARENIANEINSL